MTDPIMELFDRLELGTDEHLASLVAEIKSGYETLAGLVDEGRILCRQIRADNEELRRELQTLRLQYEHTKEYIA